MGVVVDPAPVSVRPVCGGVVVEASPGLRVPARIVLRERRGSSRILARAVLEGSLTLPLRGKPRPGSTLVVGGASAPGLASSFTLRLRLDELLGPRILSAEPVSAPVYLGSPARIRVRFSDYTGRASRLVVEAYGSRASRMVSGLCGLAEETLVVPVVARRIRRARIVLYHGGRRMASYTVLLPPPEPVEPGAVVVEHSIVLGGRAEILVEINNPLPGRVKAVVKPVICGEAKRGSTVLLGPGEKKRVLLRHRCRGEGASRLTIAYRVDGAEIGVERIHVARRPRPPVTIDRRGLRLRRAGDGYVAVIPVKTRVEMRADIRVEYVSGTTLYSAREKAELKPPRTIIEARLSPRNMGVLEQVFTELYSTLHGGKGALTITINNSYKTTIEPQV